MFWPPAWFCDQLLYFAANDDFNEKLHEHEQFVEEHWLFWPPFFSSPLISFYILQQNDDFNENKLHEHEHFVEEHWCSVLPFLSCLQERLRDRLLHFAAK